MRHRSARVASDLTSRQVAVLRILRESRDLRWYRPHDVRERCPSLNTEAVRQALSSLCRDDLAARYYKRFDDHYAITTKGERALKRARPDDPSGGPAMVITGIVHHNDVVIVEDHRALRSAVDQDIIVACSYGVAAARLPEFNWPCGHAHGGPGFYHLAHGRTWGDFWAVAG